MKKIILGASGMLGHMVFCYFKKNHANVIPCSRTKTNLDLLDKSLIRIPEYSKKLVSDLIHQHRPCKIINCVGITNRSESRKKNNLINSVLPILLSEILDSKNDGSQLVHISTNEVFSGQLGNYIESDTPDAIDIYGQSKLKG
ncbi:MAG: sugar nucleotide-binding protein, partial [Candidatus Marinimicrobia bacterium]|nr:sugar nucleotide-binding protein [Candidatus Neomarinimicrobiota bacterium]